MDTGLLSDCIGRFVPGIELHAIRLLSLLVISVSIVGILFYFNLFYILFPGP